jgi:hypothetical protein
MIEIIGLIGLGALHIMETTERAVLLLEVVGKQFQNCCSFLAAKKTSLDKVLCSSGGLEFLLLAGAFTSRTPKRQSIRLDLQGGNFDGRRNCICSLNDFGIRIVRNETRDRVRNQAFHDVVLNVVKEPGHKLDDFQNKDNGEDMVSSCVVQKVPKLFLPCTSPTVL